MFPPSIIRRGVLYALSLVALLSLVPFAGCGSSSVTDPGTTPTQTPEGLFAKWNYVGGTLWRPDSSMKAIASLSGNLELKSDMTWSHARYIGTIGAFGQGNYVVKGDTITLKHDDASGDLVYTFFVGSEPDPAGGTRRTLGLTSMKSPGEDWFAYVLREKKE